MLCKLFKARPKTVEITEDTAVAVVGGACKEGYKGPSGDPQVDVFCQAAWSAKCAGKTAELKANCDTYKSFKALNPNLPVCPYCN